MVGSGPVSRGDPGGGPYRGVWRKLPPGRSVSRNGGAGVSGWLPRGLGSGLGAGGAHRPDGGAARSSSSSAGGGVPRSGGTKSIGGRERTGGLGEWAVPASVSVARSRSLRGRSSRVPAAMRRRGRSLQISLAIRRRVCRPLSSINHARLCSIASGGQGAPQRVSKHHARATVDSEHLVGNLGTAIRGGALESERAAPTGSSANMARDLLKPTLRLPEHAYQVARAAPKRDVA